MYNFLKKTNGRLFTFVVRNHIIYPIFITTTKGLFMKKYLLALLVMPLAVHAMERDRECSAERLRELEAKITKLTKFVETKCNCKQQYEDRYEAKYSILARKREEEEKKRRGAEQKRMLNSSWQ